MIDNAPAHSRCEASIDEFEGIGIKTLPPKFQELSVFEFMFSLFKAEMKNQLSIIEPVEDQVQTGETLTACRKRVFLDDSHRSSAAVTPFRVSQAHNHLPTIFFSRGETG